MLNAQSLESCLARLVTLQALCWVRNLRQELYGPFSRRGKSIMPYLLGMLCMCLLAVLAVHLAIQSLFMVSW